MHFSEIIKLQYGKRPYIALFFTAFFDYCRLMIPKKNAWLPPIFFWIPIALAKVCFSRIVINHVKILLY